MAKRAAKADAVTVTVAQLREVFRAAFFGDWVQPEVEPHAEQAWQTFLGKVRETAAVKK